MDSHNLSSGPSSKSPFPVRSRVKPSSRASKDRRELVSETDNMANGQQNQAAMLCPFCDAPLPKDLSSAFYTLLRDSIKLTHHSPRPANENGRVSTNLSHYVDVCVRHHFEINLLPLAELKGWPTEVDWDHFVRRIMSRKFSKWLKLAVSKPEQSAVWLTVVGPKYDGRYRKLINRLETVAKMVPGYYGEMGHGVIHKVLHELLRPSLTLPVYPDAVMRPEDLFKYLLVPETALRLIMDDFHCHSVVAMKAMFESHSYGISAFPEESKEDEAVYTSIDNCRHIQKERGTFWSLLGKGKGKEIG